MFFPFALIFVIALLLVVVVIVVIVVVVVVVVVGTLGRILPLARDKDLGLKNVRHFILDECDKMLESLDMRRDVQEIFKMTPHDKQVMMFSATLSKEIRPVCKKFMQEPIEIYVDDETKLTRHGLVQEAEKNCKLNDLLDALDFNQVVIFVKSVTRAAELNKLLTGCNFRSVELDFSDGELRERQKKQRLETKKEGECECEFLGVKKFQMGRSSIFFVLAYGSLLVDASSGDGGLRER
ncbi:hypothetical protein CMV_011645 [Castanea mollissima]|uniref:Helicase ATP-binding domain-containing protein n=1 Tax=Castanea mollissima TaxID=60419 RepID=A0A8J4RG97_9ROSI|nr:hypothetical protein CMV_011645 [Castanea mollissima]